MILLKFLSLGFKKFGDWDLFPYDIEQIRFKLFKYLSHIMKPFCVQKGF
jgi:hypothetical protein